MAQYINKNVLVAEIERKYETNLIGAHSAFRNGKIEALREVKDFLNTLEVEEVWEFVSNNLEEEITRCIVDEDMNFAEVARHFAQWQKQQLMKDAVDGSVCAQRPNGEVIVRTNFIRAGLALMEKVKIIIIKK